MQPHRSRLRREREAYIAKVEALLAQVGLAGLGSKYPWELSGGMQQRASLCRALIHEPRLLMLDEPFAALDSFTREELWCVMRDLHAARPVTIVLVTHDLREAAFLADRIFCMSARPGRIIAERRVPFPRPRSLEVTYTTEFTDLVHELQHADRHREAEPCMTQPSTPAPAADRRRRPYVFTIGFFALWEAACRLFKVPPYFLPAPSVIGQAMVEYWWQLLFHSFHTLWMTLAGFAIAVVFGILLGIALGASRIVNAGTHPLLVGFNAIPKVATVPILILWFGVGWVAAGADGLPDLVLPHRRERGDRPLHHRAGAGGRDEGAGRQQVGHHGQDRHPALDALPVRLAEGGHHAGLRRLGDRRVRMPRATASAT